MYSTTTPTVTVYYGTDTTQNYMSTRTVALGSTDITYVYTSVELGGLPAGGTIYVQITGVRTPPSLKPYTYGYVYLRDYYSLSIAQKTGITMTNTELNSFKTGTTMSIYNSVDQPGIAATYAFSLVVYNPIPYTGWLLITLPTGVTMTTPTMTCVSYCSSAAPTLTYDGAAGTLKVANFYNGYIYSGYTLAFRIGGFVNPATAGTYSFTVTSYEK